MSRILIPELIDIIFQYLDNRDLYQCLFVSRQFNEPATRLIFRHLRFDAGFTDYYSNEQHMLQVAPRFHRPHQYRSIESRSPYGMVCTGDQRSPSTSMTSPSTRATKSKEPWFPLFQKEYTLLFVTLSISVASNTLLLTGPRRRITVFDF
jgi:hypothetical protein